MLKDIKDARQISLSDALSRNYRSTNSKWRKLDDETATEIFELCRDYVAKTARGNRRQRIYNTPMYALRNYGIFRRLWYDFERERIEYCCGQDWDSEHATLRDCFDRR